MKNVRHRDALGPMTGVFVDFDAVRAHLKAGHAGRQDGPPFAERLLWGVLAMVDERQCDPVTPVDLSEPQAPTEQP